MIKTTQKELLKEIRKVGVAVYSEKSTATRVGPVHLSRRKVSTSQSAGIELFEYKDGSGYRVRYTKGWKNIVSPHTNIEIQEFISKTITILNSHGITRTDIEIR